ncbi:MAG TPA: ABC transporter substrate-binding protein [Acidimicrobiales bacterium]
MTRTVRPTTPTRARRHLHRAAAGLVAALALVVAACGGDDDTSGGGDAGGGRLTFGIAQQGTADHFPAYVAQEGGFFEDEGLDVEFVYFNSGSDFMTSFASGDVQVGGGAAGSLITGVAAGIDARMTTGWLDSLSFDVVVDPEIGDWSDLEGRAVAISRAGSQTDIATRIVLEANGVDPADVNIREVGGEAERLAALQTGQTQMALLNPAARHTVEENGLEVLLPAEENDVPFQASGLVVATSFLEEDRETAAAVVRAVLRAAEAIRDPEQEQLIRDTIEAYLEPESEAEADAIYEYVSQGTDVVYPPDGHVNIEGVESILEVSGQLDEATAGLTVGDVVDTSLTEEALADAGSGGSGGGSEARG